MSLRTYGDTLTAVVNRKGVLDVDTVKGCAAGMAFMPGTGCYGACYAATLARCRGFDFARAVVRLVRGGANADKIARAVRAAPYGFFRVGTMGDPCHAWEHTVNIVEWLAPYAVPVIVTKHWRAATREQFARLVACGAILNTSVSALDTAAQLSHREAQLGRYAALGGVSVARIVSCDFSPECAEGDELAEIQERLFGWGPYIDNPLRLSRSHRLVVDGVVRVKAVRDLSSTRSISVKRHDAYIGHCAGCLDRCGLAYCGAAHPRPSPAQLSLLDQLAA